MFLDMQVCHTEVCDTICCKSSEPALLAFFAVLGLQFLMQRNVFICEIEGRARNFLVSIVSAIRIAITSISSTEKAFVFFAFL